MRDTRFSPGDPVYVKCFGGEIKERIVVEEKTKCVIVCTEDTWMKRQYWDRTEGIGFPIEDVSPRPREGGPRP